MTGAEPALRLEGVTRCYPGTGAGPGFALAPTTLAIAAGSWTVIAGRSGSGKTTLLQILGTLDRPDAGRLFILGREIRSYSSAALADLRRERLGFIYQGSRFLEHLPVWQNVTARLVPAGIDADARRARAAELLAELGLASMLDRLPRQLSGGELQRVALARAVCGRPRIVFGDEPTSNVDAETGAAVAAQLARLRAEGGTVVLATHDPALAAHADTRYRIDGGRIVGP